MTLNFWEMFLSRFYCHFKAQKFKVKTWSLSLLVVPAETGVKRRLELKYARILSRIDTRFEVLLVEMVEEVFDPDRNQ